MEERTTGKWLLGVSLRTVCDAHDLDYDDEAKALRDGWGDTRRFDALCPVVVLSDGREDRVLPSALAEAWLSGYHDGLLAQRSS